MSPRSFAALCILLLHMGCAQTREPLAGPVNLAGFATPSLLTNDSAKPLYSPKLTDSRDDTFIDLSPNQILQLDWTEPRDIRSITLRGPSFPNPDQFQIQYWYRIWPDNGTGGWQKLDDPFNGQFITAKTTPTSTPGSITFTLAPLDRSENPAIKQTGHPFRRTYKIRVISKAPARISELQAHSDSTWQTATLKLHLHPTAKHPDLWEGTITARNARILSIDPQPPTRRPITVTVNYAATPDRLSSDRAALIFNSEGFSGFSVFIDDVLREHALYVRDIDAFVSDASRNLSYKNWSVPPDHWDSTILEKVAQLPEQSYDAVAKAFPAKPPREAHLGLPNMRQEFTITPTGDITLLAESLRSPGLDFDRRPWKDKQILYRLSTTAGPKENHPATRSLEDGYLPIIHTEWNVGTLQYHQTAFATLLSGSLADTENKLAGTEPLVLLERIEIRNTASHAQLAQLYLTISPNRPMRLSENGDILLQSPSDNQPRPGLAPTRGRLDIAASGRLSYVPEINGIRYSVALAPGQSHSIYLAIPYIELLDAAELNALSALRFDREHDKIVSYWKDRIARGMTYQVPEPLLNNFFKANLWHVLITTDRDPSTGLYQHGAATIHYKNFPNETCMVAQSLELRGEHAEALRLLQPFLASQGQKTLPGRFTDKTGLLYSAHPSPDPDPYTSQGYNMHHGFILQALADHYKWTHDDKYLEQITPNLIAAADWIKRQRATTKVNNPDGSKPLEFGLAPAGDLEDVEEYLYWYATNAYYYAGLAAADQVLGSAGHPDALRIGHEAESYRTDLLQSLASATAASPVVRLRDGSYIPYVPSRAYTYTHLKEGWIREALYPALHLLDAGLVDASHPLIKWSLLDLEDNIFLSKESGYPTTNPAQNFFHFGGFTLQPNLLPNASAHLRRDEIPNFLRVFYNTLHASLYPDTLCFAEWVKTPGSGDGPLYKTPDECKFIQLMRNMLILEQGQNLRTLRLATAVPRKWMTDGNTIRVQRAATLYGSMDLEITSHTSQNRIIASINLPQRDPADVVLLRLRHPEGKQFEKVTVNGQDWDKLNRPLELIILPGSLEKAEVVAWY
ncbi:MAG: hypothetical protein NTU53_17340 [Planctomycetota bacterium]|nr:hypothetical protein [Planctomycetota bacterium]